MKKILVFLISLMLVLVGGCSEPMTEEEREAYRASCIHSYDVLSVFQYASPVTNKMGGVVRTDVRYAFTYIDDNGNLQSVDGFRHLEYGLTKVCYGENDKYVVDSYGENMRYLYLSKETLSALTGKHETNK